MQRLRFWIISLFLFTGLALNIERVDIGSAENVIDLATFVYVLSGVAVITTLVLPRTWKLSTLGVVAFWIFVYFALKFFLYDRPILGGIYTYLSIVEIVVLALLVILTRNVVENLQDLEETVASITLADVSNRVKNLDNAMADVNQEFTRSRRYKRSVGVVVIKLEPENAQTNIGHLSKDILRMIMSRYSMSNLIRSLDREIRRPDLILEDYKNDRIIVMLPEANLKAVQAASKNIQKIAKDRNGLDVNVGVAAFPDDAITFEELITHADGKIKDVM